MRRTAHALFPNSALRMGASCAPHAQIGLMHRGGRASVCWTRVLGWSLTRLWRAVLELLVQWPPLGFASACLHFHYYASDCSATTLFMNLRTWQCCFRIPGSLENALYQLACHWALRGTPCAVVSLVCMLLA